MYARWGGKAKVQISQVLLSSREFPVSNILIQILFSFHSVKCNIFTQTCVGNFLFSLFYTPQSSCLSCCLDIRFVIWNLQIRKFRQRYENFRWGWRTYEAFPATGIHHPSFRGPSETATAAVNETSTKRMKHFHLIETNACCVSIEANVWVLFLG